VKLISAWLIVVCWSEALALAAHVMGYPILAAALLIYPIIISLTIRLTTRLTTRGQI
jgi:hypothetical protein